MSKTKKAQVMFTCTHEVKDILTKRATKENRTVSNLVETLVVDAIALEEDKAPTPTVVLSNLKVTYENTDEQ